MPPSPILDRGTCLDLLRPHLERRTSLKQALQMSESDGSTDPLMFYVNDKVLAENFDGQPKWLSGTVVQCSVPVSYKVTVDIVIMSWHLDQMKLLIQLLLGVERYCRSLLLPILRLSMYKCQMNQHHQ